MASPNQTASTDKKVRWVPLESNPEVMTRLLHRLGVPDTWAFSDVYGLDPELLGFVPQPVQALILLFPISPAYEERYHREQDALPANPPLDPTGPFFIRQTIGNACGTMAVLHAVANLREKLQVDPDGPLARFVAETQELDPMRRARVLEQASDIAEAHRDSANAGQTAAPAADAHIDLHFVCLVRHGDRLFELDGRKKAPVDHGPSAADSFLTDAARVAREFMKADPDNLQFSVVSLGPVPE
ncbi:Ubiquitin carboxyl-terminal hydrolase isozyme L3 [Tieghemiomyces parasiticus]|uniref:Ubiquitin carboxyl-terminal hydrolase n=1 Tax=Tieghemiomyces parasiticus TaxID=78921 RepID=A0A9W8AKU7_9FUNG|nr:Ubiquitin carboxyl-terminal hydrolase isozyme L3 [Tieghemiomyces parasiticus]